MSALKRSAGLAVMRHLAGQWHCLVLRAYRNWDFPKGLPEEGESLLHAALRETTEETGLSGLWNFPGARAIAKLSPIRKGRLRACLYLALSSHGKVELPVSAEIGRPEHQEFRWVSLAEAQELAAPVPADFAPGAACGKDGGG